MGYYGGGTQLIDARDPRDLKSYGYSLWGASEVWDDMWVPATTPRAGRPATTNVLYAIDLVRGLDVYSVDVPGDGQGATRRPARCRSPRSRTAPRRRGADGPGRRRVRTMIVRRAAASRARLPASEAPAARLPRIRSGGLRATRRKSPMHAGGEAGPGSSLTDL